jgi:hypothetical protein
LDTGIAIFEQSQYWRELVTEVVQMAITPPGVDEQLAHWLDQIAYHFHDTRGTALANVMAGLEERDHGESAESFRHYALRDVTHAENVSLFDG